MVSVLQIGILVATGVAAFIWLRAAWITVPDDMTFIGSLQRAARWIAAGAFAACIAFALQAAVLALQLWG